MGELLKTVNLNKHYSGIKVLNNITFTLNSGEVHAVVGENGAGKSTLIKIITGVVQPDENDVIEFEGSLIHRMTVHKSRALGISAIYQDISLFPNMSVAENICLGTKSYGLQNWKKIYAVAEKILKDFGVDIDPQVNLEDISIGKQQLVAISRAIAFNAKVIVMDEPTASLSSSETGLLYTVIKRLKNDGIGIIYISHKFEEIFTIADRVSVFRDGNLIKTDVIGAFDQQSLINLMVGRELHFLPFRMEGEAGEALFSVKNLTCEPWFRDISFEVRKNEIFGITGLVGAGRSEVAQTIFGLLKADSGTIELCGKKLAIKNAAQAIEKGISYVPEDRREQGLFMKRSMAVNISAAFLQSITAAFNLIAGGKEKALAEKYISRLSIKPLFPGITVIQMSGGNQQKVLTSRWLNTEPKLLIVDEVTSGVDVGVKTEIHRLLRRLAESGVAIIMISSDLPEVFAVSDRIMVMHKGNIVGITDTANTTQEKIIEQGILG
ncbi:MAG: sugar ABC transporter ATP-binding protein [Treponema sp.]|jgi:ABC-type sugar transport system ATPase subunit|nr:sugar ABC transporter ATP-binding protein [Treponema sp.]